MTPPKFTIGGFFVAIEVRGYMATVSLRQSREPLDDNSANLVGDKQTEIEAFASYFELLSQIDERLQKDDPEYRMRYYPES